MWVNLDTDERDTAAAVGSGIVDKYVPVAVYLLDGLYKDLASERPDFTDQMVDDDDGVNEGPQLGTIAEVMAWARTRVAEIAGVRTQAVKLDLKVSIRASRCPSFSAPQCAPRSSPDKIRRPASGWRAALSPAYL